MENGWKSSNLVKRHELPSGSTTLGVVKKI